MKKIIFVTGGARSGKSSYAEKIALSLSSHPVYLATARVWDEEFRQRILRHQKNRGDEWENREEEKELSKHQLQGRVILIDCVTLWCTNYIFDYPTSIDELLKKITAEFDRFTEQEATFIFVSNEIGLGGTSTDDLQRKFTDLVGWVNQYIASKSDEAYLMVSGIPMKLKG